MTRLALGVDLGTHGARAVVLDEQGAVVASAERPLRVIAQPGLPSGWYEQDPEDWWAATSVAIQEAASQCQSEMIGTVCVTSTSGTVLPISRDGAPRRNAIMYNDGRADAEAETVNAAGGETLARLGFRMSASFGLPKILWGLANERATWAEADHILHAADFIAGRISGCYGWSDYTNVLKSGYDVSTLEWPRYVADLGVPMELLPRVLPPGEPVTQVSAAASGHLGIPVGARVCAGMTDGCADQVSSGCREPGDWNTVLGSTLVLKGVSAQLVSHPSGALYSHRHPDGWWLPGGASNAGARVLETLFPDADAATAATAAGRLLPTDLLVYPLAGKGERFPFVAPEATGFRVGTSSGQDESYAAYLQGIAFTEKLCYQVAAEAGAAFPTSVYTTGGGSRSDAWCQIRADTMRRPLIRPSVAGAAVGAAILGMSRTYHGSLSAAQGATRHRATVFEPNPVQSGRFDELYNRWLSEIRKRQWM